MLRAVDPETTALDGQGDAAASEEDLVKEVSALVSLLVAVPGHPDNGPFYLLKGLLGQLNAFPWRADRTGKSQVYLAIVAALVAFAQPQLPYGAPGIDANDVLVKEELKKNLNSTYFLSCSSMVWVLPMLKN